MATNAQGRAAKPAKGIPAVQSTTVRRAAATLGMDEKVLGRVLNGHDKASPRIRAGLAALLGVPLREIIDEETIARLVARDRAAQGLSQRVTDEDALSRIAVVLAADPENTNAV